MGESRRVVERVAVAMVIALCVSAMAAGCAEPAPAVPIVTEPTPLVLNTDWIPTRQEPIDLHGHRPQSVDCEPDTLLVTLDGVLDVDTGQCNYAAVEQPAQISVRPSGWVVVRLAHLTLFDPGSPASEGHVALAVGGEVIWERWVGIPGPASAFEDHVQVPEGIEQGEPIVFHLHNHGANEWKLLSVMVSPD